MLKGENIICISSIDWDFIWQGHQEIMSAFAASGNRVLFIENTGIRPPRLSDIPRIKKRLISWFRSVKGFRKEGDNLYIYSPLILPFPYSRIARWFNKYLLLSHLKRWLEAMEFDNPVVWTFLPTLIALDIISSIKKKTLVYYYIADFDHLTKSYEKLKKAEEKLMKQCDVIFVQGEYFKERCLKFNRNVSIFPFGVRTDLFDDFRKEADCPIPGDIANIPRPIIGYVGGVHRHMDFSLLRRIAETFPDWSVVLVGPIQAPVSALGDLKNIYFTGKKDFQDLPRYISRFDVCVVPYLLSDYTRTVYPTKINEYHMLGKPVVSVALPEVIKANEDGLIFIAQNHNEFCRMIDKAQKGQDAKLAEARICSARKNSWQSRIEQMSDKIAEVRARSDKAQNRWQDKFLAAYRTTSRKIIKMSAVLIFSWIVIFYTPFMWFLAAPLKFSQAPQAADAIVVFAGGVGESGRPGQGYEERVEHAAKLYKKGLAENIIFSSGAKYAFPESYVMKALAVSLGVPEKAIILEDKAASTYENVKFTAEALDNKNWNKIILISSPYHMRRASLVFAKIAPEKKIIYSPADSLFYARAGVDKNGRRSWKQINLEQVRAILHEYLAIVYYLGKGYI